VAVSPPSEVGIKFKRSLDPGDQKEIPHFIFFEGTEWKEGTVTFTTPGAVYETTFFIWKQDTNAEFYVDDILLLEVSNKTGS
jgi:hypothetical protein